MNDISTKDFKKSMILVGIKEALVWRQAVPAFQFPTKLPSY
jgi:hypothetical protein